jgi:hypothetical protein
MRGAGGSGMGEGGIGGFLEGREGRSEDCRREASLRAEPGWKLVDILPVFGVKRSLGASVRTAFGV